VLCSSCILLELLDLCRLCYKLAMRLGRSERLTQASNMRRCLRIVRRLTCCARLGLTAGCAKARAVGSVVVFSQSIKVGLLQPYLNARQLLIQEYFTVRPSRCKSQIPCAFVNTCMPSQSRMANECLSSACIKINFSLARPLSICVGSRWSQYQIKGNSSVLCYPWADATKCLLIGRATAYVHLKGL
jgi:hypothetical protein